MATELAKAYIQIVPVAKGIKGSITSAISGEAGSAGKAGGSDLGANLVSTVKKVVGAAALGATIKKSLDAGGALQQSFGGLDTIYGEAAGSMKKLAAEASKAGISANSYAEQAVSMGASLKQAFAGDVTKAAASANVAIMDMADNAAKMGTDLGSIQHAYQGFSKQNYTMLDNLKLGYGGTKKEMERLLEDAEKLTGKEYDINNLGDVYDAIHAIQTDLGLTGTAAAEAEGTFTGSFGSMKAAAENLMASLSTGQDLGPSMAILIKSVENVLFKNILPMVGNILKTLPGVLKDGLITLAQEIGNNAESLVQAGVGLIQGLINGINTGIDAGGVLEAFKGMFGQIWTAIQAVDWAGIIGSLTDAISTWLATSFPKMVSNGVDLLTNLANGILSALPTIINTIGRIIAQLLAALWQAIPKLLQAGVKLVSGLAKGLLNNAPAIVGSIGQVISRLLQTILLNLPKLLQSGIQIIAQLVAGIIRSIPKIVAAVPKIFSSFAGAFRGLNWAGIGSNIISGVANGIRNGASQIASAAKNAAKNALDAAKNFLGIHSPSRVFRDQVGRNMALGMAEGYEDYMPYSRFVDATDRVTRASMAGASSDNTLSGPDLEPVLTAINALGDRISRLQMVTQTGALVGEIAEEMNQQLGYMARMEAMT